MKHHINVILLTLRGAIILAIAWAILHLVAAHSIFTHKYLKVIEYSLTEYFKPISWKEYQNDTWFAGTFCIVYALLLGYLIYGLIRFYMCLYNIEKGKMFYITQGVDFKKAGTAIIMFAKLKYLLFCGVGCFYYFDFSTLKDQLPSFLAVYLIGKLILIMSYMAEKGEFIKEENELTI